MRPRAYLYGRFSSRKQRGNTSEGRQIELGRDIATRYNLDLQEERILIDEEASAFKGLHRSDPVRFKLAAILQLAKQGDIPPGSYLIIENLDRLTREKIRLAAGLFLEILNHEINILTCRPEYLYRHDSTDMADMIIAVTELCRAGAESQRKSDMCKKAWKRRRAIAKDTYLSKRTPGWLKVVDGKYQIINEKADVVRRIYKLAIEGNGGPTIAMMLNEEEIPTLSGKGKWGPAAVNSILSSEATIGHHIVELTDTSEDNRTERLDNIYPPVVDVTTFKDARAARLKRRKSGGRNRRKCINLFPGLIVDLHTKKPWIVVEESAIRLQNYAWYAPQEGERKTFPYRHFERAMLNHMLELKVEDFEQPRSDETTKRLAAIDTDLVLISADIEETKQRISAKKGIGSLLDVLVDLETRKAGLEQEKQELTDKLSGERERDLSEAKQMAEYIEEHPEQRIKLRTKIAKLVERIDISLQKMGETQRATKILFCIVRMYGAKHPWRVAIHYTPGTSSRKEVVGISSMRWDDSVDEITIQNATIMDTDPE